MAGKEEILRKNHDAAVMLAASLAAVFFLLGAAPSAHAFRGLQFVPTDFAIFSADGQQRIGFCSFRMEKTKSGATIRGASIYTNGETDYETVTLAVPEDGSPPRPLTFEHSFYDAQNKPMLEAKANFQTGEAHCADYRPDSQYDDTEILSFPENTWAGASVVIPVQSLLKIGDNSTSQLHFFSCTPGPKVYAVDIAPDSAHSHWPFYRGDLERVDVRPYFGLFDVLVREFVPHLEAWFDPSSSWDFVGAHMTRYFKGPTIIMVKAPKGGLGHAAAAAQGSGHDGAPHTPPSPYN